MGRFVKGAETSSDVYLAGVIQNDSCSLGAISVDCLEKKSNKIAHHWQQALLEAHQRFRDTAGEQPAQKLRRIIRSIAPSEMHWHVALWIL